MVDFLKRCVAIVALALVTTWKVEGQEVRYVVQLDPTSNFTTSPPSVLDCAERLLEIGFEEIESRLLPCAFGPVPTCCNNINPIFKLENSGPGAGCLCSELLLVEIIDQLGQNELAALIGFDQERLFVVFQGCGTQFLLGRGEATCPGIEPGGGFFDDDDGPDKVVRAVPQGYGGGGLLSKLFG